MSKTNFNIITKKFNDLKFIALIFIIINIIIIFFSIANLYLFNSITDSIKNNMGYYSKELNNMSFINRVYASNYKLISIIFLVFILVFLTSSIGLFLNKNWAKKVFIINLIVLLIYFILNIINNLINIFKLPQNLNKNINDFYMEFFHIKFEIIYVAMRLGFIFIFLFLSFIISVLIIFLLKKNENE